MTLELSPVIRGPAFARAVSRGFSEDAKVISRLERGTLDATPSVALGESRSAVYEALIKAFAESHAQGWDGYGGSQADPAAVSHAIRFLIYLPSTMPNPEVAVDADGDIAFEWDRGPRRVFSVRVSRDGTLYYAGRDGLSTFHGTETLLEGIPEAVAIGIERIVRCNAF